VQRYFGGGRVARRGRRLIGKFGVNGRIILKSVLKKLGGRAWHEFVWLKLGASGWLLWGW
jgi:hypothetical protein